MKADARTSIHGLQAMRLRIVSTPRERVTTKRRSDGVVSYAKTFPCYPCNRLARWPLGHDP